ncbi:hypothetical protein [Williamsia sterculiae]|uniref:Uncharacterized protein n=1 Tax=Williamsia sterculiae TaxID=1344003 RepID=A0A1N7H136_9NOCA|nr:hypothetical protein [Williamsia sterculiae]SIS18554.1 hypothetical protein SAMN05445060_3350 [Williamsia sterculiae]
MRLLRTVGLRLLVTKQDVGRQGCYGYTYELALSKSTLNRYENGTLPPLELAEHLDQLYEADGWIDVGLRTLWRPKWDPWEREDSWPQRYHFARWPARFSGLVWIKVVPAATSINEDHSLMLAWGPWNRTVELPTLGPTGVLLTTGKAKDPDGISRTLNFVCDKQTHVLFGAGEDFGGENVLDIHEGWTLARP